MKITTDMLERINLSLDSFSSWSCIPYEMKLNIINNILEMAAAEWSKEPFPNDVIAVFANGDDRRYPLGYAIGASRDIAAYYKDQQQYGLDLEPIQSVIVPEGYADMRADLELRKAELESELDELNKRIQSR
jgi:hypothetical protein